MARLWGRWKIRSRFNFVGDTIAELRKVIWPSRGELLRLTIMVLAVCVVVALILGLADFGFGTLVRRVFISGR